MINGLGMDVSVEAIASILTEKELGAGPISCRRLKDFFEEVRAERLVTGGPAR
jgi:hypothetical protein